MSRFTSRVRSARSHGSRGGRDRRSHSIQRCEDAPGRKRSIVTDTLNQLLAVLVTAASVQDSTAGTHLINQVAAHPPSAQSGPTAALASTSSSAPPSSHRQGNRSTHPRAQGDALPFPSAGLWSGPTDGRCPSAASPATTRPCPPATLPARPAAMIHLAMTDLMARRLTGAATISWRDPWRALNLGPPPIPCRDPTPAASAGVLVRRAVLRRSLDTISRRRGLVPATDHIHHNSRGAALVAEVIDTWLPARACSRFPVAAPFLRLYGGHPCRAGNDDRTVSSALGYHAKATTTVHRGWRRDLEPIPSWGSHPVLGRWGFTGERARVDDAALPVTEAGEGRGLRKKAKSVQRELAGPVCVHQLRGCGGSGGGVGWAARRRASVVTSASTWSTVVSPSSRVSYSSSSSARRSVSGSSWPCCW